MEPKHISEGVNAFMKSASLVTVDGAYFIINRFENDDMEYEVPISECDTAEKLVNWIFHLTEKQWMTREIMREFVRRACNQSNIELR